MKLLRDMFALYANKSLLVIADKLREDIAEACLDFTVTCTHQHPMSALPPHRFDAVIVDQVLEGLTVAEGRALLGTLRNSLSEEVWVFTQSEHWQLADFIALGFIQEPADDLAPLRLYRFRLADYNHQRSWNNSRYWANPQNFNRFRW